MRKQDIIASSGKTGPSAPGQPTGTNDGVGRPFNNGKINVSFVAPFDGKLAITSYTVTPNPATVPATISGSSSPISVTGLTSDTDYTFTVTATNGVGTSVPSPASLATKATTVPQTPTAITLSNIRFKAYGTNPEIGVNVSGGFATGGSARTGWDYSTDNGVNYKTITDSTGLIFTLPTQSNNAAFVAGASYSALIRARNVNGPGGTFNASPTQVGTVPQQPSPPFASRISNTQASLTFTIGNNGGLPLSGLNVTTNPVVSTGISWSGTTSPLTVTGTFLQGTSYTFSVSSTNSAGTSTTSSPSNSIIVNQVPTPNFPTPNFPTPNFAPNFPTPNFPTPNFPTPNFPTPNFPTPNFPTPNFPTPNFPTPNFPVFCDCYSPCCCGGEPACCGGTFFC